MGFERKIILPGEEQKEVTFKNENTGIFKQKIHIDRTARNMSDAFGVSMERKKEILTKLIAVAKVYPRFAVIMESFLNCEDRFTEMERLYGLYLVGKTKGHVNYLKMTKTKLQCDAATMPQEMKLLALMSKDVEVENKFLLNYLE